MGFRFQTSNYDAEALLPQVSRALEDCAERLSRGRHPRIWGFHDKVFERDAGKKRKIARAEGILFLLAGLFLLVPGLAAPGNPELLAGGIAGTGIGCLCLWTSRKGCGLSQAERDRLFLLAWVAGILLFLPGLLLPLEPSNIFYWAVFYVGVGGAAVWYAGGKRRSRFDKAAETLLSQDIGAASAEICFTEEGMQATGRETVPYSDFSYIMETEGLYIFLCGGQAAVLQKKDVPPEVRGDFFPFLAERLREAAEQEG